MTESKISWLVLGSAILAVAWGFWLKKSEKDDPSEGGGGPGSGAQGEVVRRGGKLVGKEDNKPFTGVHDIPFEGTQNLVRYRSNYVDGLREGESFEFFAGPAQRVRTRSFYTKGVQQGQFLSYHPNGVVEMEGMSVDGSISGMVTFFDLDSSAAKREIWDGGANTGKPAVLVEPPLLPGPPHEYQPDSEEFGLENFENPPWVDAEGKPFTGTQVAHYSIGGAKAFEHAFVDGREDGMHQGWDPEGKLEYQRPYLDRKKHGVWKIWGRGGKLLEERHFNHGRKVGTAKSWFPTGELAEQRHYVHDFEHGTRQYFNKSGKLRREMEFDHGLLVREREFARKGDAVVSEVESPPTAGESLTIRAQPGTEEQAPQVVELGNIAADLEGLVLLGFRYRVSSTEPEPAADAARPFTVTVLHDGNPLETNDFEGNVGGWIRTALHARIEAGERLSLEIKAGPGNMQIDLAGIGVVDEEEDSPTPAAERPGGDGEADSDFDSDPNPDP